MTAHAVSDCYICQLRLVHRLLPFCGLKLLFACKESKSRRIAPDQHGGVAFRAIGVKDRTVALCQARGTARATDLLDRQRAAGQSE